jgi:hypothetical protein
MPDRLVATTQAAHASPQAQRITTPGRHEVNIDRWDFANSPGGPEIVFSVHNDSGARQCVRFGFSELELGTGTLDCFITTVLQRKPVRTARTSPRTHYETWCNQLVGCRVLLVVEEYRPGVQFVWDWEAVPQDGTGGP